uniref:Uncharacterized protein n=1 Tax=Glossina austeni TaxID=7395 RepID=A0A1A9VX07_GLOAU
MRKEIYEVILNLLSRFADKSGNTTRLPSSLFSNQVLDQHLHRYTAFPIVNANNKSIFERLVDVLIGDGSQDPYAMICK